MKDIREAHVAAVRNAIFKTVGLTQLSSTRRKNSKDVIVWKSSKEVKAEYNNLYKDETLIENITAAAFPSLNDASDKSFSNMYIQWCAKLMTIFKIEIVSQQLYQLKHTIYHFKAKKL